MGQRSQIYVRIERENGEKFLIAKYFQWNFAERMISRARYGIEYIKESVNHLMLDSTMEKINRIFDVNFDMIDVAISSDILTDYFKEEWYKDTEQNKFIFNIQDNNDGKLFIDVNKAGKIKYCFTDYEIKTLFNAKQYMDWDYENWENPTDFLTERDINKCKENIKNIQENAELMSHEELEEFINADYTEQLNQIKEKILGGN